ncbi:hypothetical protein ACJJTC_006667 [Scirpophaga incertulas]
MLRYKLQILGLSEDIVIVMGDLTAKLGEITLAACDTCARTGWVHETRTESCFFEFCQTNYLTIGGTLFIQGDHHRYTWNSPDGVTKNQSDHLAISSTWRTSLLDVCNRRGADIDSDHHLVVAEVRLKVSSSRSINALKISPRFDVSELENQGASSFKLELRNRFSELDLNTSINSSVDAEWNRIKMIYNETSSAVLRHKTIRGKNGCHKKLGISSTTGENFTSDE